MLMWRLLKAFLQKHTSEQLMVLFLSSLFQPWAFFIFDTSNHNEVPNGIWSFLRIVGTSLEKCIYPLNRWWKRRKKMEENGWLTQQTWTISGLPLELPSMHDHQHSISHYCPLFGQQRMLMWAPATAIRGHILGYKERCSFLRPSRAAASSCPSSHESFLQQIKSMMSTFLCRGRAV